MANPYPIPDRYPQFCDYPLWIGILAVYTVKEGMYILCMECICDEDHFYHLGILS